MEGRLTPEARAAICKHMNDDHVDAIAAYARVYGNVADVQAAAMLAFDERAMELAVDSPAGRQVTRIAFDHELVDAADARDTLIAMARHAMTDA